MGIIDRHTDGASCEIVQGRLSSIKQALQVRQNKQIVDQQGPMVNGQ